MRKNVFAPSLSRLGLRDDVNAAYGPESGCPRRWCWKCAWWARRSYNGIVLFQAAIDKEPRRAGRRCIKMNYGNALAFRLWEMLTWACFPTQYKLYDKSVFMMKSSSLLLFLRRCIKTNCFIQLFCRRRVVSIEWEWPDIFLPRRAWRNLLSPWRDGLH